MTFKQQVKSSERRLKKIKIIKSTVHFLLDVMNTYYTKEFIMLSWALTFFIIAIIAGVFGFSGIAASMAGIAKILFFVFLALLFWLGQPYNYSN